MNRFHWHTLPTAAPTMAFIPASLIANMPQITYLGSASLPLRPEEIYRLAHEQALRQQHHSFWRLAQPSPN